MFVSRYGQFTSKSRLHIAPHLKSDANVAPPVRKLSRPARPPDVSGGYSNWVGQAPFVANINETRRIGV